MSMFAKIGSWFAIRDEEDEDVFEPPAADGKARNVVALTEAGRRASASVAVFAPRAFSEVTEIADALRGRQVAILNLQGADRALLQRVVDFTSGVAYTLDGRIQKLAESIYLVVPAGIVVNSQYVREQIDQDGMLDLTARFGSQNRP